MIESLGIIGAGTMGNGIAQVSAAAGLSVTMVDISDAAVKRGLSTIDGSLDRLVKKEKMSAADREAALKRINATTDKAKLADCDLVIEAATENEELKVKILKDLCATLRRRRWSPPTPRRSRSPSSPPRPTVPTASSACTSSTRCRSWRCWN